MDNATMRPPYNLSEYTSLLTYKSFGFFSEGWSEWYSGGEEDQKVMMMMID